MDFFDAQENARRTSRWLILWFALCVLGVIVSVYGLIMFIRQMVEEPSHAASAESFSDLVSWDPLWFIATATVTTLLIGGGSLFRLQQLSAGGLVVAEALGGRRLDPSQLDPQERRFANVVEEMAIASGVPVPEICVLDEDRGINAFAAGTDPANAVIGVTRGALERLTRSELQGVVAHEFSHILNGDMKLNQRLMGWIFGLVMISALGSGLLRLLRHVRGSRNSKGNGIILVIVVLGAGLWLIGSIGVLFSRMLQAAISRQREYLADASAVQFTRDPSGISGALKKVGAAGGYISSPAAAEARHLFFAGSSQFGSWMPTHPPLEKRIRAIDPRWDGKLGGETREIPSASETAPSMPRMQSLGDAKIEVLALLVGSTTGDVAALHRHLTVMGVSEAFSQLVIEKARSLTSCDETQKIERLELAMPWLRRMEKSQAGPFTMAAQSLVEADGQIDLFEFLLLQMLRRQLLIGLGLESAPAIRHQRLQDLEPEVAAVLAMFSSLGGGADAAKVYREYCGRELPTTAADFARCAEALKELDASTPIVKRQILQLCTKMVVADGQTSPEEHQLLRATADAIGAPMPKLMLMDQR
ncbi:MAG TPA: M48 family metallopeptidase [Luteolibacter sp.]|nr:M48 family metallopeptidase [Luteolibacter sp.]